MWKVFRGFPPHFRSEFAAQQENMKQPSTSVSQTPKISRISPNGAGLSRATLLYRRLRSALEAVASRGLTYEDLAELTGEARTTLCNWYNGDGQPSAELLLSLLEFLPAPQRSEIFAELPFCRCFPTLQNPRLAHDPVAVSVLKTIVGFEAGITLVRGQNDDLNTFVITALGHSFGQAQHHRGRICGLDIHNPDWFVPLPNVTYLNNAVTPAQIRMAAEKVWPALNDLKRGMIVLNGTWTHLPDLANKTRAMSADCHVLATELSRPKTISPSSLTSGMRVVTVTNAARDSDNIHVEVYIP